jgi:hemerythrin superfamily protein
VTDTERSDAVEMLRQQHDEIRTLMDAVNAGTGASRQPDFETLVRVLAVHETSEEEVVYPAVSALGREAAAMVQQRKREEGAAKRALADLEQMGADAAGFADAFVRFSRSVDEHAAAEEATIFPLLEAEFDAEARRGMATLLKLAQATAPTHAHRFVPESAIGNLLVGPFVAVADRVRDAIRDARR